MDGVSWLDKNPPIGGFLVVVKQLIFGIICQMDVPLIFEFTDYQFQPQKRRIVFRYQITFRKKPPLVFAETIFLPGQIKQNLPEALIKKILESLHIMLGISYWKFYCPAKIKLPYVLAKHEADFWNEVWKKGLGEFFYRNRLDPKIAPQFPHQKKAKPVSYSLARNQKILAGIGGGKESAVAAELLKSQKEKADVFFVETGGKSKLVRDVIKKTGLKPVIIRRQLDEKVFEKHLYNGHVPVSAIYAFLGILAAVCYGYDYVAVGNEHSSNFGNSTYRGMAVNHQWSKSLEFELLLRDYADRIISPDIRYFSLLRPLQEIRIAKLFSAYRQYFPVFSSCNRNFSTQEPLQQNRWCLKCPKCVFTFLMLSAWLSKADLLKIFGRNLYQDPELLPLFADILGLGNMKPFDCVGTFEEAQTALQLAAKNFSKSAVVKALLPKTRFYPEVFLAAGAPNLPDRFRLLGLETVLILGYGREGKVTWKFLKKYYPKLKITIGDESRDAEYLKKQHGFDLAVKTPGIKKDLVGIPYTTATNLFLSHVSGKYPVIGVTGSKGKSTTASLIFSMLKAAGKNVQLLGNIGKPMLSALLEPVAKGTIFVLELSSYQLQDIQHSPDIAVVTSLFPEHLDYHGTLASYYQAKRNIIKFQSSSGYFIHDAHDKKIHSWLKDYRGRGVAFAQTIPLKPEEIPLSGKHNERNVRAAAAAARLLGCSDAAIRKAVLNFKPLPHRLEYIGEFQGIHFYDDAIATTPEATMEAIKALKRVDTIFLGGQDRGYDFFPLEKMLKNRSIKNVVLFPDSGKRIIKNRKPFNVLEARSMEEAVRFAYRHTAKGKICLLSCASPSYSLWKNFEEKGDEFKRLAKRFSNIKM